MPRENHKWVPGEEPPKIRPHSLAKHRVIDAYLRRYVDVLTQNRRIPEFRLTLVDGFSGGGVYRVGAHSSLASAQREASA
jgi:three-Cys-motif partner protein